MKEQLFSTLKESVEILQNHKMTPQELKATEFIKKYPLMYSNEEDKDYWIGELAELIGPEIDLDLLAVENEKKNQRIMELKNGLHELCEAIDSCIELTPELLQKTKQLLNQKP